MKWMCRRGGRSVKVEEDVGIRYTENGSTGWELVGSRLKE